MIPTDTSQLQYGVLFSLSDITWISFQEGGIFESLEKVDINGLDASQAKIKFEKAAIDWVAQAKKISICLSHQLVEHIDTKLDLFSNLTNESLKKLKKYPKKNYFVISDLKGHSGSFAIPNSLLETSIEHLINSHFEVLNVGVMTNGDKVLFAQEQNHIAQLEALKARALHAIQTKSQKTDIQEGTHSLSSTESPKNLSKKNEVAMPTQTKTNRLWVVLAFIIVSIIGFMILFGFINQIETDSASSDAEIEPSSSTISEEVESQPNRVEEEITQEPEVSADSDRLTPEPQQQIDNETPSLTGELNSSEFNLTENNPEVVVQVAPLDFYAPERPADHESTTSLETNETAEEKIPSSPLTQSTPTSQPIPEQKAEFLVLGVFGKRNNPSAMIQTNNGEILTIEEGAEIEGWTVRGIDSNQIVLVRDDSTQTFEILTSN